MSDFEEADMFTNHDLNELLSFKADQPVISVYLNTEPSQGSTEVFKLKLRGMLKDIDSHNDIDVIMRYFDHEHNWSGNSVVVFSCQPMNWFKSFSFAIPVYNRVRIGNRPHVKPLVDLLDSYGGYGVVLIDKQSARLFNFHMGELREETDILGETIRRTKRGGGSQALGRRGGTAGQTDYVDEVADRNMRDVADMASQFFREREIRRIIIGGSEDNVAQFRSLLPKTWQSLVVGTFPISMTASHNDILEKAIKVGQAAEIQQEIQLVKKVVTSASKGKAGVLGLDDTLHAIKEKRVQLLLIREGYREPGKRCQSCGYLTSSSMDTCPYCDGKLEEVADTIEVAVRNVIRSAGDVEIIRRDQDITGFNQIGALLRY